LYILQVVHDFKMDMKLQIGKTVRQGWSATYTPRIIPASRYALVLSKVSDTDMTVLITGKSGTVKEK